MRSKRLVLFLAIFLGFVSLSMMRILVTFHIKAGLCIACGQCVTRCPVGAISVDPVNYKAIVDPELCVRCGACARICPTGAARPVFVEPQFSR